MEKKRSTWIRVIVLAVICIIIGVVFLVIMLSSSSKDTVEDNIEIRTYVEDKKEYTLENDDLLFVMDASNTQFTLTKKSTGEVWYSNPVDADSDSVAKKEDKNNLKSTAILQYSTVNGVKTLYNNFGYSIDRGIYEIETGEDYIKVNYTVGNTEKVFVIPLAVPESRMNELMVNMDKKDQKQVNEYYRRYDIDKLKSTDNKDELLASYPDLANERIFVLRDGLADYIKEKIQTIFETVGYTYEDYEADLARYNVSSSSKTILFNYSMVYKLDGDDLIVTVPMSDIEYSASYPLIMINVLPYFGAGTTEESGYMFVPEGGGSIINFNNGKLNVDKYFANMYGYDYTTPIPAINHETKVEFPVYGLAKNGSSFICILEKGSSYASIKADISGRQNSYNAVSAEFNILNYEAYDVSGKSSNAVYVYQDHLPDEDIVSRYHFMDSDSYVDMALDYRDYLLEEYPSLTKNEDASTPVAVEIIGAIDKVQQKLGLPASLPLSLTTYKQAQEIIAQLIDDGFENMSVKYTGWMNGGVNQKILKDVDLVSRLGNKKSFNNLISFANENNIPLYLNGIVENAYDSDMFDGFLTFRDAAKSPSQEKSELYHYDPISYEQQDWRDSFYLLKPSLITELMGNLADAAKKYNAYGVSFSDIGDTLSADYNKKSQVTREENMNMQVESLKEITDSGLGLMINTGNAYAVPYSDFIIGMNLAGSQYTILDKNIPFYQIALHGYVNYSGEAINLSGDYEDAILRSAEAGASLYFVFMSEETTKLQNTMYKMYFGANFETWEEDAINLYQEYNEKLGSLFNQTIVDHYYVANDLTATVYEDGSIVYVNYSLKDYNEDGLEVPARSYIVEGGK